MRNGGIAPGIIKLHVPWPLYSEERALGAHLIGGWNGPTDGLAVLEKRKVSILPEI
jgi:hypothetical protein